MLKYRKKNDTLFFSGPLGFTELNLKKLDPDGIGAISLCLSRETKNEKTNNLLNKEVFTSKNSAKLFFSTNSKAFFGCVSSIIQNKIHGVTRGFLVYIRIIGVGYRAQIEGLDKQNLYLKLGFSSDIKFELPESIRAFLLEPTLICLYGIDKNQVTQVASKIKKIKIPSVYKGKGIRLAHENISLKTIKRK